MEMLDLVKKNEELLYRLGESNSRNENYINHFNDTPGNGRNSRILPRTGSRNLSRTDSRGARAESTLSRNDNKTSRSMRHLQSSQKIQKLLDTFYNIQRIIIDSDNVSHSRRMSISEFEANLDDDSSNFDAFSALLRQLEYDIGNYVAIYNSAMHDVEIFQQNYEELDEAYKALKFDLENSESAINNYERELIAKNEMIKDLELEKADLWNDIRAVNQGLTEIEEDRERLVKLNDELSTRMIELRSTTVDQELKFVTEDRDEVLRNLETKEKEMKDISDDLLNCEAELESKDAEIAALHERIKSLKTQLNTHTEDFEKNQETNHRIDKGGSALSGSTLAENENHDHNQEIVNKVFHSVSHFFDDTTIDNLAQHLDEMFESFKGFDDIVEQLHKTNVVNSEITNLIDEKDKEIGELKSQLSSNNLQICDLETENEQIKQALEAQNNSARLEELENIVKTLEQDLNKSQNQKVELETCQVELGTNIQKLEKEHEILNFQYNNVLEEDKIKDETIQMLEEAHQRLNDEKEQLIAKKEQLINDKKQLIEDKKMLKRQMDAKEGELNKFRDENENLLTHIDEMDKSYDQLMQLVDEKDEVINNLVKECTKLTKDNKKMHQNYNKEATKSNSLERRILSLVRANTSVHSSPGSVTVGTAFKQKTFQRMLQLEKDMDDSQRDIQALRAELKTAENELIMQSEKYASQGSDFFGLLSNLLMLVSKSIDEKLWHENLAQSMDDIRANPTNHVNNCNILCTLILDGVKIIADNCVFYENQIMSLKQQQSPEAMHLPQNQQEYQHKNFKTYQNRTASSELMQRMSTTFMGQIWIYRYTEIKKRFEKEREARKLEFSSYRNYVRQLEDDLHKYQIQYKDAVETLNIIQAQSHVH